LLTFTDLVQLIKDPHSPATIAVIDKGVEGRNAYLLGSIPKLHIKVLLLQKAFELPEGTYADTTRIKKLKEEPKYDFTPEEMEKTIDLKPCIQQQ
jgi:hypothetical protein